MKMIAVPLEFLDLLSRLVCSWIDKYTLRAEDIELLELVLVGIYGDNPPRKREPGMAYESSQLELFTEIRKEA